MAIEQYEKYQPYLDFIKEYAASSNAATGSKLMRTRTLNARMSPP